MREEEEALRYARVGTEHQMLTIIGGAMIMGVVSITGVFAFLLDQRGGELALDVLGDREQSNLGRISPTRAAGVFDAAQDLSSVSCESVQTPDSDPNRPGMRACLCRPAGASGSGCGTVQTTPTRR